MRMPRPLPQVLTVSVAALGVTLLMPQSDARACGCFVPPDPSVPVVQAGERIVFGHEDGMITAHIQIQYQGEATDFGWLLPLPAVPELKLGVEELFSQLINTTQPKYRLNRVFGDQCGFASAFPGRGGVPTSDSGNENAGGVVVVEDSIGPYDYAVLRADTRDEMFNWLTENRYFIPAGTEDVSAPYIRPGAYFLALKLRKGNDAGDIQPVVLRYASDLPMIPIILTQVAANPDMGVQVWVLGEHRAIPRNYHHTIINEEYLDWFNAGANYNDVIIKATNEAPDGQSFVTEYAGSTDVMKDLLDYEGRFGRRSEFERITDVVEYVSNLRGYGFTWSTTLINLFKREFPMPQAVRDAGIDEDNFYQNLDWYLGGYRESNPRLFEGFDYSFDPVELTGEIWERIVTPTFEAGTLFRKNTKMTRMYTTLSPEEMTRDPVFSYNPTLPDVDNVHEATFTYICSSTQTGQNDTPGILELPDGRRFYVETESKWLDRDRRDVPYSRRIELLREEGPPEIQVDNSTRLSPSDMGSNGCACSAEAGSTGSGLASLGLGFALLGIFVSRRRR